MLGWLFGSDKANCSLRYGRLLIACGDYQGLSSATPVPSPLSAGGGQPWKGFVVFAVGFNPAARLRWQTREIST